VTKFKHKLIYKTGAERTERRTDYIVDSSTSYNRRSVSRTQCLDSTSNTAEMCIAAQIYAAFIYGFYHMLHIHSKDYAIAKGLSMSQTGRQTDMADWAGFNVSTNTV